MYIEKFFEFIQLVDDYSSTIPNTVIDDLCNGTLNLEDWKKHITNLRKEFEKSMFVNCVEKPLFKDNLVKVAMSFQSTIKGYREIVRTYLQDKIDFSTDKKNYYLLECHRFMLSQLNCAYGQIKINMSDLDDMSEVYWASTGKPYIKKEKDVSNSDISCFSDKYSNEQLHSVYDYLIENNYLHHDTDLNDFLYYFSGRGNAAVTPLSWIASSTDLALFVSNFFPNEDKIWKKTEIVFGKKSNYATLLGNMKFRQKEDPFALFVKDIKKM